MMMDWTNMYVFGVTHWFIFAVMVAIVLYPTGRILNRIGFSPFWSVLALIPLINLIGLWLLALMDWPEQPRKG
jgi:predicted PurR-regulated permease PerM